MRSAIAIFILLLASHIATAQRLKITSPNGRVTAGLYCTQGDDQGQWYLDLKDLIPRISVGLIRSDQDFSRDLKFIKASKPAPIAENYTTVHGKRSHCTNKANEITVLFENAQHSKLELIIRAYDDGLTFRYRFPAESPRGHRSPGGSGSPSNSDSLVIKDELTAYTIAPTTTRWLEKWNPANEGLYHAMTNDSVRQDWCYPALFNIPGTDRWFLIHEAALDSTYCATKLSNVADAASYKLTFPDQKDGRGLGASTPSILLPWQSPWRVIIVGTLADIVGSTLVEDVSPPSVLSNTSWIKPGIASWNYWSHNHGTKDYRVVCAFTDLAARMNWPYTLFDWEWDAMSNGGNLEDAAKYALSKGVRPLIWYNSGGPHTYVMATPRDRMLTHENRVTEFGKLKKLGFAGVKVDFFESEKQDMIRYYLDILQDAAAAHMMVYFHGCLVPRGWSRTWPNLMTCEAVRGAEWYNNGPDFTLTAPEHNCTLPFTRNVVGPMDYTPVTFTNSQFPHVTSYGHELALSVVFESGLQHFADRPEGYDALPAAARQFLMTVPNAWDDTKLLAGYPGREVVMARRKGQGWWLGGINGTLREKTEKLSFGFLPAGIKYKLTLIADGEHDKALATSYQVVDSTSEIEVKMLRRGGFAATLVPIETPLSDDQYKGNKREKDRLAIFLRAGELDIVPLTEKAIRIRWTKDARRTDSDLILIHHPSIPAFTCTETPTTLHLSTRLVTVSFDKTTAAIQYEDAHGHVFLREKAGSRRLSPDTVMGERCYQAEQTFESPTDESLFGLGQFQDGNFNLRNISRQLIQVNTQIAVPFLYSSKGYGLLWRQYGLTEFNPADSAIPLVKQDSLKEPNHEAEVTTTAGTQRISQRQALYTGTFDIGHTGDYCLMLDLGNMDNRHLLIIDGIPAIDESNLWLPPAASKLVRLTAGKHTVQVVCRITNVPKLSWRAAGNETTFRSPNATCLDYVVFTGKDADDVIACYRNLSGNVPLLPLWAYGFWQCRERYTSGEHLVKTVEAFRERQLPMDVIVQDWQYWGKYGWGVPRFDEDHYPDPDGFIRQLHDLHAHFVISVWENLDKKSEIAKPYVEKNLYLPNSPWIDIFNPETRRTHWAALDKNLFRHGVDGWWMDATEPENDALKGKQTYFGPGDLYRLTYPLFVSRAVYEGQRAADPAKRVCILTRSAFAGQQRYGTINWSGDIGSTWDSYRRQIVAGLDYTLTGLPYWTTDIGGFFRPGKNQYTDPAYRELLTRWFQWGAFNPVFRIHGYQTETEPWNYGDTVMHDMRLMLELRYKLLPYIYATAWQVTRNGSTMMRPLVMDFPGDTAAIAQPYEYMFGKALLVAPVTTPGAQDLQVYLPEDAGWYDFWTGAPFKGAQIVKADAPLSRIPLFVRSGAILPMGPIAQSTADAKTDSLEIRVYTGADGAFTLYFDESDGYNYEKGKHQEIPIHWDERRKTLSIGAAIGDYTGALHHRIFHIITVNPQGISSRFLTYNGKAIRVTKQG